MRTTILTIACLWSLFGYCQQTQVLQDTLSNDQGNLSINYTITCDFSLLDEVEVSQYSIVGSDTIPIFYGIYNLEEDDPSEFLRFSSDETNSTLFFHIGTFEPSTFYSTVKISRLQDPLEEFIFN